MTRWCCWAAALASTPMLSMVNWCFAEQPGREVWLFYGARFEQEAMARSHLEALAAMHPNFHLHVCFSDTSPNTSLTAPTSAMAASTSTCCAACCHEALPLLPVRSDPDAGQPGARAGRLGGADARIHFEAFWARQCETQKCRPWPPPRQRQSDTATATVSLPSLANRSPGSPGSGNLLDFAEAHGIAVNSGCRSGSCGGCQTKIRTGGALPGSAGL